MVGLVVLRAQGMNIRRSSFVEEFVLGFVGSGNLLEHFK